MDAETRKVLQDARRGLLEFGWLQRCVGTNDGPRCLGGAIQFATPGGFVVTPDGVGKEARALGFSSSHDLVGWNNAAERTLEDVIARLDEALTADPEPAETRGPVHA